MSDAVLRPKHRIILKEAARLTKIGNAMLLGPEETTVDDLEYLHRHNLLSRKRNTGPTQDTLPWAYRITRAGHEAFKREGNRP